MPAPDLDPRILAAAERVRHEHRLASLVAPILRENYRRNLPAAWAATGLDALAGSLAGEPAILVAAGPSLDEAAASLRGLGSRAWIFCVDTALRRIVGEGVQPDLAFSVDPHRSSLRHFEGVPLEAPLAFLPSVFPEVVARHRGPTLVALPRGDRLGEALERSSGKGLVGVAGTVSYFAIEVALRLGCDPLIFVGLDLAIRGVQHHCTGAVAHAAPKARLLVPGQDGGEVETTAALDRFRHAIELRIAELPGRTFVNTSPTGARIGGALAVTLGEAIARWCARPRSRSLGMYGRAVAPPAPPAAWQRVWAEVLGEPWGS
jgi:hypothetical protein